MRKNKLILIFKLLFNFYYFLNNDTGARLELKLVHSLQTQWLPATAEEVAVQHEGVDSDRFSDSNSSFLMNEKLMSVDSMNTDITGMICIHHFFPTLLILRILQISCILYFILISKNKCRTCFGFLDDDMDSNNLPDDELELYFNKLVPPAMQRGRVEGQEIPATVRLCYL